MLPKLTTNDSHISSSLNDTYVLQIVYQQREYRSLLLWPNGSYRSASANEHLTTRDTLEGHLTQTTTPGQGGRECPIKFI